MYFVSLYYDAYGLDGYNQYNLEEHQVSSFQPSKEKCLDEIKKAIIDKFGTYDDKRVTEDSEREIVFATEILPDPVKDF